MDVTSGDTTIGKWGYAGLFMVALATLLFEVLLTRIFSVTMWYHFAFMAISVAMFGMTLGALLVYVFPVFFTQQRAKHHLAFSALAFALSIVFSFLTHLSIPFFGFDPPGGMTLTWAYSIALTYVVLSMPFLFSGICVSLALTKFPRHVSKLYAADLAGAALGCIFLIVVLHFTDGPNAVIVTAFLASLGGLSFALNAGSGRWTKITITCTVILGAFAAMNGVMVARNSPWLNLMWVKGRLETRPLYEKWNSFSRVQVYYDPASATKIYAWGLSPVYQPDRPARALFMNIDVTAGTILSYYDGDQRPLEYLKYDVTNIVHYIKREASVLVVGTGGGRDVLSALVFGQKSVLGIEINRDIIHVVNGPFGDFTGHLDRIPRVTFVNDEARSYIARSHQQFDIIQVSLIDTWAATAAGAFVLCENSLYTVEAWNVFLDHLSPGGVLSFSRWYMANRPLEMYRLTSLACASLKRRGVASSRNHLVIMRHLEGNSGTGIGTLLVSRAPFSDGELDSLEEIARRMKFDLVLSPRTTLDPTLSAIASGENLKGFISRYPWNISAPTDDSPFFFNTLRLRDVFNSSRWRVGAKDANFAAVRVLAVLLIIVIMLTFLCIIIPLVLTTKKVTLKGTLPLFIFFACIGLGFMLIEISQIQRLSIFLGHPTYGLSVGLFALLLSSGLGSITTWRIGAKGFMRSIIGRFALLIGLLIIFGLLTPTVIPCFQSSATMVRILVAIGLLLPLGVFMGMAFPLGMKIASSLSSTLTPWLWGINGAMSVSASVLAIAIALNYGITTSFWTGSFCYLIAVLSFVWAGRRSFVMQ
jgi:hypothetical protein